MAPGYFPGAIANVAENSDILFYCYAVFNFSSTWWPFRVMFRRHSKQASSHAQLASSLTKTTNLSVIKTVFEGA